MKLKNSLYFIIFAFCFVWQTACVSSRKPTNENDKSVVEKVFEKVTKANFPPPSEADFETEKAEAQKLFDWGITFENIKSAHGMRTEKGVSFGSNDFESSDGVKLLRYGKLYETPEELKQAFDNALKGAAKVFEKKNFENGEKMFIGVAGNSAFIVNTSGYYLYTVSSPSLRHLLAFEIKEAHYFSYKSAD